MSVIAHTITRVLGSATARKIDFRIGSIGVNGTGLARIQGLVALGTISTRVVPMEPGVGAQYDPGANTLEFPSDVFGTTPWERCTIVHECIHALHDMYGGGSYHPQQGGSRFTPRSENEAAAYIGGALYYLYETGTALTGTAIFDNAAVIAQRIANRRGALVTTAEARALRLAIVLHPKLYNYGFDSPTIADGV